MKISHNNLTPQEKEARKKYVDESLPNWIAYIVIPIIIILALLADNL